MLHLLSSRHYTCCINYPSHQLHYPLRVLCWLHCPTSNPSLPSLQFCLYPACCIEILSHWLQVVFNAALMNWNTLQIVLTLLHCCIMISKLHCCTDSQGCLE